MTVCIAGIQRIPSPQIIAVTDQRVSLFGGWFSKEGQEKHLYIHKNWLAMFAGGVEETSLMIKEIRSAMEKLTTNSHEEVVNYCRKAFAKARRRLIETQILPEYDLLSYEEYKSLITTDKAQHLVVQAAIANADEKWTLLFAGFDDNLEPHIFVISGPGKVEYCDSQEVASIGSGAVASLFWLSFYDYRSQSSPGQSIFGILSSKFFAERASDVGRETICEILDARRGCTFELNNKQIEAARKGWESLPKISTATAEEITNELLDIQGRFDSYTASERSRLGS